jgi:hypothetical protein
MSNTADDLPDFPWQRLQIGALLAGCGGLGLCLLGYFIALGSDNTNLARKVFFSYLFAYLFVLGLGLGCLAIWMLHNLTGGAWGMVIRRFLDAGSRTLPLLAVLFIPIALGMSYLYVWVNPEPLLSPLPPGSQIGRRLRELLEHKSPYLNVPFFLIRAVLYFAIWLGTSWLLNRWAEEMERTKDVELARRSQTFSGRALVLFGLAVTFAAFDWVMSLEPTWFSTIFGVIVGVGQLVPAMAFAVAAAAWLLPRTDWGRAISADVWNDLGSLMLALVMLWAYVSFAQLLLVWSGNLPAEITWYVLRSEGGWEYVGAALALFYFAVPFLLLLMRNIKRHPDRLMWVGVLLVVMSLVHQFWLVAPVYYRLRANTNPETAGQPAPFELHWLDGAALVGLGGLWLAFFLWQLQRRPLTPPPDPLAQEEELSHA